MKGIKSNHISFKQLSMSISVYTISLTLIGCRMVDGEMHPSPSHVDLSKKNEDGAAAIHAAIQTAIDEDNLDEFNTLLQDPQTKVNAKVIRGNPLLLWAVKQQRLTMVKTLLKHPEVDPNKTDNLGNSPLLWAVKNGWEDIAKSLLDHPKINPDQADNTGHTLLYWATTKGYSIIVDCLRKHPKRVCDLVSAQSMAGYYCM